MLLLVFAFVAPEREADAASWWNSAWKYRRKITVIRAGQTSKNSPAMWVKFHCGGGMKTDGSDLRATNSRGKPVKCTVKGMPL